MSVGKELIKQAQKDTRSLEKLSSAVSPETMTYLKDMMRPVLGTLAAVAATGGVGYMLANRDKKKHDAALMSSFKSTFERDPSFAKKPSTFAERFSELTVISPTIAKNPALASKIIRNNFSNGFEIDDIHKLTAIESHSASAQARAPMSPANAGRAAALAAFGDIFRTFGPDALKTMAENRRKFEVAHTAHQAQRPSHLPPWAKPGWVPNDDQAMRMVENKEAGRYIYDGVQDMEKKAFQLFVSEETLGQMLAERHIMIKEAAISFKPGIDALKNSFALMAPALALGGGAALIAHALESRRNAQLSQQADLIFKGMKNNDVVQSDPEAAQEAFATLKAIAPSLAARPMVAKTFVENVVRAGAIAPDTVSMLAEAENKVRGIQQPKGGFLNAFKSNVDVVKGVADFANMGTNNADKMNKLNDRLNAFAKRK